MCSLRQVYLEPWPLQAGASLACTPFGQVPPRLVDARDGAAPASAQHPARWYGTGVPPPRDRCAEIQRSRGNRRPTAGFGGFRCAGSGRCLPIGQVHRRTPFGQVPARGDRRHDEVCTLRAGSSQLVRTVRPSAQDLPHSRILRATRPLGEDSPGHCAPTHERSPRRPSRTRHPWSRGATQQRRG